MLPKTQRLRRADFGAIRARGRSYGGALMRLTALKGGGNCRFAVVVPKKVSPRAVVRNVLRRRVYDALRGFLRGASPAAGIVFLLPAAASAKREVLLRELGSLLRRSGVR